ncbi:hypothetical protein ACFQVC_07655 [Streptomyces monticola]|uniref:Twin-arginine translocation signal domain-containing protein n=1 Tax=Streptomyces monticola TaxID=2666263 RepID=A0ABW2JDH9_9ACTN
MSSELPHPAIPLPRRVFLARTGLVGAAVAGGLLDLPGLRATEAQARPAARADLLGTALRHLALDTLRGLAAFVLPGSDRYSVVQGTPRTRPGGVAAEAAENLLDTLDNYLPFARSWRARWPWPSRRAAPASASRCPTTTPAPAR